MSKAKPSKRRSIHANKPLDEITDNVKNNAIFTRSQAQEKLRKEVNEMSISSDENGLSGLSSDEDMIHEDMIHDYEQNFRRDGKSENLSRERRQQNKKVSRDQDQVDSSFSSEHEQLYIEEQTSKCNGLSFLVIVAVLVIGLLSLYLYNPASDEDYNIQVLKCGKEDVECITNDVKRTIKSMKEKYKNQDDNLWLDAFAGIKSIIQNPTKPSIIVLLGKEEDPLNCLAVLLGNVSSNALNSGLLKLTPEKFENDMGLVIRSLRSSIKDKKAVIVWDLLNINEEALKAFHNLCDRINPLVEEVIYIITIIADDYDRGIDPLEYVEKKLHKKLSGKLKEDAIQPLITRITDGPIIAVRPEPDIIDCPLARISQ